MGVPKEPPPVKLIASLFSGDETLLAIARGALISRWGLLDYESELLPFSHTSYYAREFGDTLLRQIIAFANLVRPDELAPIKRATNELESLWTIDKRRRVNIDPGYVSMGKLVLATTKDYAHRIYIGQGIYAEVTLQYHKGGFRRVEYTYPDYASTEYLKIFDQIRALYHTQTHGWKEKLPADSSD